MATLANNIQQDLQTKLETLESQRIDLLSYHDFDSVTSSIESYLPTLELIGKHKINGKRFYKTKLIKNIESLLRDIFDDYCKFTGVGNWNSWREGNRQLMHQNLICLLQQQKIIIRNSVIIYSEDYLKCSHKKLKLIMTAESMIKDILKAVDYMPNAWCYDISSNNRLSAL